MRRFRISQIRNLSYNDYVSWTENFAYAYTKNTPAIKEIHWTGLLDNVGSVFGNTSIVTPQKMYIEYGLPDEATYAQKSPFYWMTHHILTVLHEYSHVIDHMGEVAIDTSPNGIFRALTYFVSENNDSLYSGNESNPNAMNYGHNINEIYAEYNSAIRTRELLIKAVEHNDKPEVEQTILNVLNDRIMLDKKHAPLYNRKNDDLLQHSWGELKETFKDAIKEANETRFSTEATPGDACYWEMQNPENARYLESLNNEPDPREHMRKLACFTFEGLLNAQNISTEVAMRRKTDYPCLDKLDLTYKGFDKPFFGPAQNIINQILAVKPNMSKYSDPRIDPQILFPPSEDDFEM